MTITELREYARRLEKVARRMPPDNAPDRVWEATSAAADQANKELEELQPILELADTLDGLAEIVDDLCAKVWCLEKLIRRL